MSRVLSRLFVGLVLLSLAPLVRAEDAQIIYPRASAKTNEAAPATKTESTGSSMVLMVALLAAGGGGWFLWKQKRSGGFKLSKTEQKLTLAETKSLGNRQFIVVATYENQKFLLGVCPGRIELLTRLDEKSASTISSS